MTASTPASRLLVAALALTVALGAAGPLTAQSSGAFRVLIPAFMPVGDISDKFGDRIADRLRDAVHELASHDAIEEKDIEDRAEDVAQLEMKEMDCVTVSQLASYMGVEVYICGEYTEVADKMLEVKVTIGSTGAGAAGGKYELDPFTVHEDDYEESAADLLSRFNEFNEQAKAAGACDLYFGSANWAGAMENCTRALEMNPAAVGAMFTLAATHLELEQYADALKHFEGVIALDPVYNDVLNLAGYSAAMAGEGQKAQEYYSQHLMFDPTNVPVRLSVAYDLAVEGNDPEGGMAIIKQGIDLDAENVELNKTYADYAFFAGRKIAEEADAWASGDLSDESRALIQEALEAYRKVKDLDPDALDRGTRQNLAITRVKLKDMEGALAETEDALRRNPRDHRFHDLRATIFTQMERNEEALEALDQAAQIAPDSIRDLQRRRGMRLMALARLDEAVEAFTEAIDRGEVDPDPIALQLVQNGYDRIGEKDFDAGIRIIGLAEGLNPSAEVLKQVNFFKGFGLIQKGIEVVKPETVAAARASKPIFEQAIQVLRAAGDFETQGVSAVAYVDTAEAYIERADIIIKIGGGSR